MTLRLDGTIGVGGFDVELSLEVERGETVALVGPNGAGKSTVVRAIAGLEPLRSGRLALGPTVWDDPAAGIRLAARERSIGVMFQQYLLFAHLSAVENVAFGLRARGVHRSEARRRAQLALDRLDVGEVAARMPDALSGGQAQRVALARALVGSPDVLLLDEPLAALDVGARAAVRRDLRAGLERTDGCRLLVTHDPVDAHELAHRIVVLEGGRVTQSGSFGHLASAPRSTYVAELMGTNVLAGELTGSTFVAPGRQPLHVGAHELADGPALVAIRPMAIALHTHRPEGSPRNVWRTEVAEIDRFHERVRVRLGPEIPLVVEVTEAGLAALGVVVGDRVWASVKASEITVVPDS
jgi:molybdate transport system ATP-binding protein